MPSPSNPGNGGSIMTTRMIAVIGAGPAGLEAALAEADRGNAVVLIDAASQLGGQYWRHLPSSWGSMSDKEDAVAQRIFDRVLKSPHITWISQAHVWQAEKIGEDFHIFYIKEGVEAKVVAQKVVLATGAYDRTLPIPGWTLPGIMTPGAAQAMIKTHGVLVGQRIVVAGTGPFLLPVATGLAEAGATIVGFFEYNNPLRWVLNLHGLILNPAKVVEALKYFSLLRKNKISIHFRKRVESIDSKSAFVSGKRVDADIVAIGWGFTPDLSIASILGAQLRRSSDGTITVKVDSHQQTSIKGLFAAGESTGIGGSVLARVEGRIAGGGGGRIKRWRAQVFARGLQRVYPVPVDWQSLLESSTTVCRCEEVTLGDICDSITSLGAENGRTAKLFTRAGMGLCQGRVCGRNVSEIVAAQTKSPVSENEAISASQRPLSGPISLGELGDGLAKGL